MIKVSVSVPAAAGYGSVRISILVGTIIMSDAALRVPRSIRTS